MVALDGRHAEKLISPWTGNKLGIVQFVQACFVWWGLLSLWATTEVDNESLLSTFSWLKSRATGGFEKNPFEILKLSSSMTCVHASTLEAIEQIQCMASEIVGLKL